MHNSIVESSLSEELVILHFMKFIPILRKRIKNLVRYPEHQDICVLKNERSY